MARPRPNHIVKRSTGSGEVRYLARVGHPDPATGKRREMGKTFRTAKRPRLAASQRSPRTPGRWRPSPGSP